MSKKIKRQWDMLSDAKRESSINEIIRFFAEKRDEEIGVIAAEEVLDFFLQMTSRDIFNSGVRSSQAILKQRFEDLDIDLDLLISE